MAKEKDTSKLAKSVRSYRKWHKYFGLSLALFVLVSAVTGILLAWKKNIEVLQPPTQKGVTTTLADWQPVDSLARIAVQAADSLGLTADNLDRIEYRPTKGIAKVIFDTGSWEVQVDATTLEVLSVAKRHSDWIEQLHDGTIISDTFKLISMNYLGIGLIVLLITGIWLWLGPRKIRKLKS